VDDDQVQLENCNDEQEKQASPQIRAHTRENQM